MALYQRYSETARSIRRTLLDPGSLRERVTIQQRTAGSAGSMGPTFDWSDLIECMAAIRPLSGREMFNVQQRWSSARFEVTTQYIPGVKTSMRLCWQDGSSLRTLDILDVQDPHGMRDRLVMICAEIK